jgi:LPS sulfotransferase NodH
MADGEPDVQATDYYRRRREAFAYLLAALPRPASCGRTLIFGQGRSGSTLLESLLSSTGHFVPQGEVFGRKGRKIIYPERYLRGHSSRWPERNFLCHVKIHHLVCRQRPVEPQPFLQRLSDDGWSIIFLRRTDRVRQALSHLVAEVRGEYHKRDDQPERIAVHVKRDRLEALVKRAVDGEREEQEALADIDYHEVVYERDLEDASKHQQTIDGVLDFLMLPRRPVSTSLRKVIAQPLREVVLNYDEFAGWVTDMGLQASLREDQDITPLALCPRPRRCGSP